jgi:hypothetical protein
VGEVTPEFVIRVAASALEGSSRVRVVASEASVWCPQRRQNLAAKSIVAPQFVQVVPVINLIRLCYFEPPCASCAVKESAIQNTPFNSAHELRSRCAPSNHQLDKASPVR